MPCLYFPSNQKKLPAQTRPRVRRDTGRISYRFFFDLSLIFHRLQKFRSHLINLVFVCVVLFAVVYRYGDRLRALVSPPAPSVTPTALPSESQIKAPPAPPPAPAAPSLNTDSVISLGCAPEANREHYLNISAEAFDAISKQKLKTLPLFEALCYQEGKVYNVLLKRRIAPNPKGIFISYVVPAKIRVDRVRTTPAGPITESFLTEIGFTPEFVKQLKFESLKTYAAELTALRSTQALQILDLTLVSGKEILNSREPAQITLSTMDLVHLSDLKKLMPHSPVIIDVRPAEEFAKGAFPNAINIPYQAVYEPQNLFAPFDEFKSVDRFDPSRIPRPTTGLIIFYGANFFDHAPLRALIWARMLGWKNISWYRGGQAETLGFPVDTPASVPGLQTVSTAQAQKLLQAKGVLVSTLPAAQFAGAKLPNAINATYFSQAYFGYGVRGWPDQFEWNHLPKTRTTPLIFYGEDYFDWFPMRAAMAAKKAGWKYVYWYRGGFLQWQQDEALSSSPR